MPLLKIELIPSTCHYSSARTMITKSQWDKIRKLTYGFGNMKCKFCGINKNQLIGRNFLECHEVWNYDDENHIQKLVDLECVCTLCHLTKHIGRAIAIGNVNLCHKQLARVNKWTPEEIKQHILESFKIHKQRSKFKWALDLSILNSEPYNLNIDTTQQRIFEIKTYKKKNKKKSLTPKVNKRPPKNK